MPKAIDISPTAKRGRTQEDRRRIRTRQKLIKAGQQIFRDHGFDAVRVDDIIQAAMVSKGSFYNHFPDKDMFAREILHLARQHNEAAISVANLDETDPARRLARAMCIYARGAIDEPEQARCIARLLSLDISPGEKENSGVVADVANGIAAGRLAAFTLEVGVSFIIGVTQALVARVLAEPKLSIAVSISHQFITLTLRAFGLSPLEAEIIAAQASDAVIRQGVSALDVLEASPAIGAIKPR